jgi:hypothetical protein
MGPKRKRNIFMSKRIMIFNELKYTYIHSISHNCEADNLIVTRFVSGNRISL